MSLILQYNIVLILLPEIYVDSWPEGKIFNLVGF